MALIKSAKKKQKAIKQCKSLTLPKQKKHFANARREQAKAHKKYQRKINNTNTSGTRMEKTRVLAYEVLPLEAEVAENGIKMQATLMADITKKLDVFTDTRLIKTEKKICPPTTQKGQEGLLSALCISSVLPSQLVGKSGS